jgi:SAM-dependent methyltransferase
VTGFVVRRSAAFGPAFAEGEGMTTQPLHAPYSDATGARSFSKLTALLAYKARDPAQMARVKATAWRKVDAAIRPLLGSYRGRRAIDLGAGQWMAQSKILAASGADVLAVDPELPPAGPQDWVRYARGLGLQRTAKTLAAELLLRSRFDRALGRETGLDVPSARFARHRGGAERLPFADGEVDLVVSDNVYEHLPDVRSATDEVLRVLRPGGVVCITIHPFTAFSGGHHPATIHHAGDGPFVPAIPAWDHLLDGKHPSGVYLNRVRNRDYRDVLASRFETIRWDESREGEAFLDAGILARLPDHTRDEFLVGKIFYVGIKPT